MRRDTKITMEVDTEKINEHNVDQHVKFKDNRKNRKPAGDPANFTSEIDEGKHVFWYGVPVDGVNDTIQIKSVTRKKKDEPELLETRGKDPEHKGAYRAKVKNRYVKGEESYYLEFTINDTGPVYKVDPKLEMSRD